MRRSLLLINPAMMEKGRRLPNAGGIATMEPLALSQVAALTPPDWEVRILDEVREDIPDGIKPDLVGITSLSVTVPRAYDIARRFRQGGVPVVLGGIHATLLPDEAARHVDVVFQGDAEGAWSVLIQDFEAGALKQRYNGGAPSLRAMPIPRRDLYRKHYFMQLLSASRGCRHHCEFCTLWRLAGGRYRMRPVEDVLGELGGMSRQRPILFTDENIYTDREWALTLFRGMAEGGLKRPYAVQTSLDLAEDGQALRALQHSGCVIVLIGFESVSEESLRTMRKHVNLRIGVERYKEMVTRIRDHGIAVSGAFIFGNDGDDPGIFQRTAKFIVEAGIDVAHLGLLTPNPGTDLYDRLAREGRLLYTSFPEDYGRYDIRTAVFRPRNMTPEQLESGIEWTTRAVGSWRVVAKRAWRTWRAVGKPSIAALSLSWNRSGLYRRVMAQAEHTRSLRDVVRTPAARGEE